MKVCPECDREYGEEVEFCAHDGSRLRAPEGESEDALTGRILDDRWRIEEKIGEGGMGSIYLASQESVGREVAVKTLRTALSENDEFSERFMREARVTSSISHPHCVTIFDFGRTDDDTLYLAMEFLEGEPLADRMEREPVAMRTIIEIGIQVASALSAAHQRDVIHRDLKPDNIFLLDIADGSTFTKVLDFGISKELGSDDDLTQTGQIFGTPDYMSPEQARGDELDPRTDLYSLGCILYEMVAETPPFDEPKAMKILMAHIQDEAVPVSEAADRDVPDPVASLIMELLEKDREDRPESAEAVRGSLEEIFENFVGSDSAAPAGGGAAAETGEGRAEEIGKAATVPPSSGESGRSGSADRGADVADGDAAAGPEPERRVAASERDTRPKTELSWVERNKKLVIAFIAIATVGGLLAVGGGAYVAYQGAQDGSGPLASWVGPSSGEAESEEPSPSAAEERGGRTDDPRGGAGEAPDEKGTAETDEKSGERGGRAGTGSVKEGAAPSGEGAGEEGESAGSDPGETGGGSTGSTASGGGTSDDGDDPSFGAPAPAGDEGGSDGGADGAEEPGSDESETGESEPDDPESDPSGATPSDEKEEPEESGEKEESGPDPAQFVRRKELSATGAACNKPDIERRLSAVEPQLGRCFSGGAGGSLMLEWTISTEGEPLEAAALTSEVGASVESCAVRTVEALTFSPPDGGRCYTRVTFEFGK